MRTTVTLFEGLLVVLLGVVIGTTSGQTSDFDCSTKPSGLYPNPNDCRTFYKCSNGLAYLYQCPSILHFNPRLLVCDWPEVAGCTAGPTTTTQVTTPSPTTTTTASSPIEFNCTGRPNGLFPNSDDCGSFFRCASEVASLYQCPTGLHFNPTLLMCDWPYSAGCQNEITVEPTTSTTTTTTTESPTSTAQDSTTEEEKVPTTTEEETVSSTAEDHITTEEVDPTRTEQQQTTTTGESIPSTTEVEVPPTTEKEIESTTGEPVSSTTEWEVGTTTEVVSTPTENRTTTEEAISTPEENLTTTNPPTNEPSTSEEPSTTLPPPTDEFNCTGQPNGLYPNLEDCETFFKCSNGFAYLYDCPDPLHFNPIELICDWPDQAGCMDSPSTTDGLLEPTTDGLEITHSTTDAVVTSTEHTSIVTSESTPTIDPTEESTADVTYTDSSTRFSETTEYSTSDTFEPSTEGTPEPTFPTEGTTEYSTTEFVNGTGLPITSTPEPTVSTEGSTELPITSTTPIPTNGTTPQPPAFCWGRPCGVYVDPNSCEGFIICADGNTTYHTCPPPLRFNSQVMSCDLPERVSCFSCEGRGNGLHQNVDNCRTFFMCSRGNSYLFNCPQDLVYRPEESFCDYEWNAWQYCYTNNGTTTTQGAK